MKKLLLIMIVSLLLIANVMSAGETTAGSTEKLCRVKADIKEATEQIITTKQVQDTESKVVKKTIDISAMQRYGAQLHTYKRLSAIDKAKTTAPVNPVDFSKGATETIQVPKYIIQKSYSIDWSALRIVTKSIRVPVMKTIEVTENKLRDGFEFDSSDGLFYQWSKC